MKINDKSLCAFAVSATAVDKEGYLNMRDEQLNKFPRRYVVLKGNFLFYFQKKGGETPVGVIILHKGCKIELCDDEEYFCFKIVFHGTNNCRYIMGADSEESVDQWMKALNRVVRFDCTKLKVGKLQRQLDHTKRTFNKLDSKVPHHRSQSVHSTNNSLPLFKNLFSAAAGPSGLNRRFDGGDLGISVEGVGQNVPKVEPSKGRPLYDSSKPMTQWDFLKQYAKADGGNGGTGCDISSFDDDQLRGGGSNWKNKNYKSKNDRGDPYYNIQRQTKRKCGICRLEGHTRQKCPFLE